MASNLCGYRRRRNNSINRDEAGIIRGQEERRSCDFMGLADPPHRNQEKWIFAS